MKEDRSNLQYRIAIVEDDDGDYADLEQNLQIIAKEGGYDFLLTRFGSGEDFLKDYLCQFDIVFMDIELVNLNGMETARKLREIDPVVTLVFVTRMEQFAIQGYEVQATGYVLKPVRLSSFRLKLQEILLKIEQRRIQQSDIIVQNGAHALRLATKDILYIEVKDHYLYYHMAGSSFSAYGKIKDIEEEFQQRGFIKCNRCYLINPYGISEIKDLEIVMANGDHLWISSKKRKEFMEELVEKIGGG